MLIRESTLRRIIREEAARVMNEQAPTASGASARPVAGTVVGMTPIVGPKDPAKIADAKAKFIAAGDALTYTIVNLKYIGNLATALTYRNSAAPGDERFQMISKILENGLSRAVNDANYGPGEDLQRALVLLAVGEVTAKGQNPMDRGYIFAGDSVLSHFIPKFESKLDDIETWKQSGTVGYKPANDFANSVRPIASKIVKLWNNFTSATRNYNTVMTQPGIGTGAVTAPVGVSTYSVVRGDLVSYIAQRFYGSIPSNLRAAFYKTLTKGADPNRIEVGQQLSLPNVVTMGGKDYKLNKAAPPITYAMGKAV